ncbi:MAG: hypothetical protein WBE33_08205, partial [Planococcus citreus]
GRVLSQRAKEHGTFVSPARSVPQESAISAPSLFLEQKIISSAHKTDGVEMHRILSLASARSKNEVSRVSIKKH